MSDDFITKDSGERRVFETGSVRDSRKGKGRFDLIPAYPLKRLAQLYERGAEKYADNNWQKGQPLANYLDSAMRHLNDYRDGDRTEDHLIAVAWNVFAYIWTERAIEQGKLPASLGEPAPAPAPAIALDVLPSSVASSAFLDEVQVRIAALRASEPAPTRAELAYAYKRLAMKDGELYIDGQQVTNVRYDERRGGLLPAPIRSLPQAAKKNEAELLKAARQNEKAYCICNADASCTHCSQVKQLDKRLKELES